MQYEEPDTKRNGLAEHPRDDDVVQIALGGAPYRGTSLSGHPQAAPVAPR
jgi:hypothetical protein